MLKYINTNNIKFKIIIKHFSMIQFLFVCLQNVISGDTKNIIKEVMKKKKHFVLPSLRQTRQVVVFQSWKDHGTSMVLTVLV